MAKEVTEFVMAFEFDFNETFKWCALYLAKGLRIIRLNGIRPDGTCTCGDPECAVGRSKERSCGKHPVGRNWGAAYARDEDDLLSWDDGVPFNVGIVLGPDAGHMDSEDDTPEGSAFRQSLGLDELITPSWTSGRSTHQLMLFDDAVSNISKAEPGGLECRIGGGGAQMQSVLPPSWHYSGVRYQWKPGLSIDDVDPVKPPRNLLVQIHNYTAGRSSAAAGTGSAYKGPLVFRKVRDGEGRHRALLLWSWHKIVRTIDPLDSEQRAVITKEIQDANEKYIDPAKSPSELLSIVNSCFEHYRRKVESGWSPTSKDLTESVVTQEVQEAGRGKSPPPVGGLESHGLERYEVGDVKGYRPGNWSIQMVQGDPPEIVLIVPAWKSTPCKGRIHMSFDTFRSAAKVASAVFLATRRVILDGDSAKWVGVWKGTDASKKSGKQSVPGLMEQLVQRMNAQDEIQVGTSSLRYAQLAGYVIQIIKKATKPKDEDKPEPNESGRPCWVTPDELWLQWGKIWEDIARTHPDVASGERLRVRAKLLEAVGQQDFTHKRHRFAAGRMEYVVFTKPWIDALERLAAGEDGEQPCKADSDSDFSKTESSWSVTPSRDVSPCAATT